MKKENKWLKAITITVFITTIVLSITARLCFAGNVEAYVQTVPQKTSTTSSVSSSSSTPTENLTTKINSTKSNLLKVSNVSAKKFSAKKKTTKTTITATTKYVDPNSLDLLAHMISAEAKGECVEGKKLVGWVILNRLKSNLFPNTLKEVLFQDDPIQFDPISSGSFYDEPTKQAIDVARYVLTHKNPTKPNLLYFKSIRLGNTTVGSQWWKGVYTAFVCGGHVFAYQQIK